MKKAKEGKIFREGIAKGDSVVTIGGVHGKVLKVNETTILIECEGNTRLLVERSAISPEYSQGTGQSDLAANTSK